MTTSWTDKPVTLLGLSKTGMATAQYLSAKGAKCFLSETVPASPANKVERAFLEDLGVEVEMGGHSSKCFEHSDLVIVSPGIPPHAAILKELAFSEKTIISEVELAYRETDVPFIGITGTNGKTTTTTLIAEILQASGKKAPACGNIGIPIISLVDAQPDYLVAELSSFQLAFSPTLQAKIALFLNFRPDHLDWHGSVEAYKRAKFQLFLQQSASDWAILNVDDPVCRALAEEISAQILWFSLHPAHVADVPNAITLTENGQIQLRLENQSYQRILDTQDLTLMGRHNYENVMAAAAACVIAGVSPTQVEHVATSFQGVAHRLEHVATLQGIAYYNDSKATNPDAAISALSAFSPKKVVLIAGGRDKKTDLAEFITAIQAHTVAVVLIGEAAGRFSQELESAQYAPIFYADSLAEALQKASCQASVDVPVLFSPACASFDMFKNYEARGQAFKEAVHRLMSASACGSP